MRRVKLIFRLLSYWHAGSGAGCGPELDAQVVRTGAGLPLLPGRSVKGIMRAALECAERAGAVAKGTSARLFGSPMKRAVADERERALEAMRFMTESGRLRFESARVVDARGDADAMERYAAEHPELVAHLFRTVRQTAIGADGLALDETLRSREVALPLELVTEVTGPDDEAWIGALEEAALFVHGIGSGRHRGFGRVEVEVEHA